MPNWTSTSINIEFVEEEDAKYVHENILENGYSFDETYVDEEDEDWYNNRLRLWGTKWNTILEGVEHKVSLEGKVLGIVDYCAWAGPSKWFHHICNKYNVKRAHYSDEEPGNDFHHIIEYADGELDMDEEFDCVDKRLIELGYADKEHFLESYEWILDDEDWESEHADIIRKLVDACGMTTQEVIPYYKDEL